MRRAARSDANQAEIIDGLRAIGASVYWIKEPVDLLVGFRKRTIAMEVKTDKGRLTKLQEEFFQFFEGEAYIVHDLQSALKAVTRK